jgi:hypothetical protein
VSDLLLPQGARLVHIGPHKTGSTAIQHAMHASRERLLEHGVHYAGTDFRPRRAGWAIVGGRAPVGRPAPRMEDWYELVADVEGAGDLRVCISNEDFARATPEEIARIVEGLGGDRAHVVAVVRRLDKYLPSQWQERVKARETRSYDEWLRVILGDDHDDWHWKFTWQPYDVERLVEQWTEVVGKDRMTLVVADEQDRSVLPAAFEQMLGLATGTLQPDDLRSNRSLSYQEAELVRALNTKFHAQQWPEWSYGQHVQGGVVTGLLARPRPAGHDPLPGLPPWAAPHVEKLSRRQADAVRSSGVRVIGDPERLVTPLERLRVEEQPEPPAVDLETAAQALEGLLGKAILMHDRQQARQRRALERAAEPGKGQGRSVSDMSGRELLGAGLRRAAARLNGR